MPSLIGPEFSSDSSADGPNERKEGNKSMHEDSNSSDTKSDERQSRPTRPRTPTKPRWMSKRKYKNLVRKHRTRYPKVTLKDSALVQFETTFTTLSEEKIKKRKSKAVRDREYAALLLKRCRDGRRSRRDEYRERTLQRQRQDPAVKAQKLNLRNKLRKLRVQRLAGNI